jgi:hypothetical protein
MPVLAFLRRLVVVGRGAEDRIYTRTCGEFLGFGYGFVGGVGGGSGDDGDASRSDFDRSVDDMEPLVVRESRRFSSRPAGNEEIDPGIDLPRDKVPQSCVIDRAVLMKRRYECSATSTKLHMDKIARMRVEGKCCERSHREAVLLRFLT